MSASSVPIKVLVADDHGLFRAGLTRMLSHDPRFEVVGEASDGLDAIEQAVARKPDVVLMDLQMPRANGAEAVRLLKAQAPEIQVLVISAYTAGPMLAEALASGASGYLNKDVTFADVASRIIGANVSSRPRSRARSGDLSSREIHVLRQVAAGLSNKQIARRLGISDKTVRNHLSRIFNKLRATNRTEAVMNAMRVGIAIS